MILLHRQDLLGLNQGRLKVRLCQEALSLELSGQEDLGGLGLGAGREVAHAVGDGEIQIPEDIDWITLIDFLLVIDLRYFYSNFNQTDML